MVTHTASLFLLSLLFVYPFVAIIPDSATVPALFMVGVYSIRCCSDVITAPRHVCLSASLLYYVCVNIYIYIYIYTHTYT